MLVCSQLVENVHGQDAKLFQATQVVDEGRHNEVLHRYLALRLDGETYPLAAYEDMGFDRAEIEEIRQLRRQRAAGGDETAFRKFFRRDLHAGLVRNMRKVGVLTNRVAPDLEALGISLAAAGASASETNPGKVRSATEAPRKNETPQLKRQSLWAGA